MSYPTIGFPSIDRKCYLFSGMEMDVVLSYKPRIQTRELASRLRVAYLVSGLTHKRLGETYQLARQFQGGIVPNMKNIKKPLDHMDESLQC